MNIHRNLIFCVTTILGAGVGTPAVAQSDSDIIVTARRVEERLQDVPISISVVSQSEIADRNITNASQLSQYVPSLSTDQRYGGDTTTFNIRGFYQENVSTPTVGVYFADAIQPRGNSVTNTPSGDGVGAGNLFDLQNVQVLKGPQGTLFGRNTTGGVVMLVPRKPTDKFEGYAEFSIGNYGLDRQQAVLNVPLADAVRLRLGFDRQQRDGYLHNISGVGPSRFGESNYYALRGSLVLDLAPGLENYTVFTYSKSDPVPAINSILACNEDVPLSATGAQALVQAFGFCRAYLARGAASGDFYSVQNALDAPVSQKTRQWQAINTTTWQVSDDVTLKNIFSYSEFTAQFRSSIFGENYIIDPATVPATLPFGRQTAPTLADQVRAIAARSAGGRFLVAISSFGATGPSASQRSISEEVQLQGRALDGKLTYQGGLYLESSDPLKQAGSTGISSTACLNSSLAAPQCTDLFREYVAAVAGFPVAFIPVVGRNSNTASEIKYRDYGIYAQSTFALTDQLKVTAGLRYSWDTMDGRTILLDNQGFPTGGVYGSATTPRCFFASATLPDCVTTNRSKTGAPTGLIDLEYTPNNDVLLYVKYSRGYRQGGIQPRSPIGNYDKESIDAYEAGTKLSFRGSGLTGTFNLAAFYNKLRDQQLQASLQVDAGFPQALLNVGSSEVYGLELDSRLNYGAFHVDVAGSYLQTKIKSVPSRADLVALVQAAVGPGRTVVISTFPSVGEPLPLAPKFRLVMTPSIDLPIPEHLGKINLSGTMVYTAKTYRTSPDGFDGPNSDLNYNEATTLFNANLNWRGIGGSPIDLSAFVTNVTGKKYIVAYLGGWTNSVGSETGRQGEPRMYGARVRYSF